MIHTSDAEFYWGTPMKAALAGAIQKQATLDLDGIRSVVLITDGEPTSCDTADNTIDAVVNVAKGGMVLGKPVATYVVGVIDGDTIDVVRERDGESVRVRVIGINAPERDECFYDEATSGFRALVPEDGVRLVADATDLGAGIGLGRRHAF